jgi:polysaccharide export outer membrane protein
LILGTAMIVTACSTPRANAPSGADAYRLIPATPAEVTLREYRLQPADRISVSVYGESDLSLAQVEIDTAGRFAMPLLGPVEASGKTTEELATMIESQLGARYLRQPHVAVNMISAALQRVIVDGSVNQPGIYELRGTTTLIGALALARGTSRVAQNDEVVIFRHIDGQLMAAKFDIAAIRLGNAPDPEIRPNDRVVVGFSGMKQAWRDFLQALPVVSVFRPFID